MKITGVETDEITVNDMVSCLLAIDQIGAMEILKKDCDNESPFSCIERIVVPSLQRIGQSWEDGDASLSQVYMSGKLCESMIDSMLSQGDHSLSRGADVSVAVLEDHHTLGKRILISILRTGGYRVKDYGHGLTVNELVKKALEDDVKILMVSTLMLNAALKTKEAISAIKKEKPQMRIIVGGAPYHFDTNLWKEVGADAWGRSATDSLHIVDMIQKGEF